MTPRERKQMLLGLACLALGGMVVFGAFGLGPMGEARQHAPRWIIALGGTVFCGGGVLMLEPPRALGHVMGALIVAALTTVSAWVALFADAARFSGSSPSFLPADLGTAVARGLFGLVALLGLAILLNALRHLLRHLRD